MISLILLPFRGIFWLISGCLCTLPWLLIVAPLTINYWLPTALSIHCEKQLGFPCRIGSTNVNLMKGQMDLNDIVVSNPNEFASNDFLKIKQIHCKVEPFSYFQGVVKITELNVEISQFASIQQNKMNNLQKLCEHFNHSNSTTKSKKGWHIASAKLGGVRIQKLLIYTFRRHAENIVPIYHGCEVDHNHQLLLRFSPANIRKNTLIPIIGIDPAES